MDLTNNYPCLYSVEKVVAYASSVNVTRDIDILRISITGNITLVPTGTWFVRDTATLEISGQAGTVTISPTGRTLVGAQLDDAGRITTYDGLIVERVVIECVGTNKFRITNYA
jgi:hypothetical protein